MRRIGIILLASVLLLLPLCAFADGTVYNQGNLQFRIEDGGITIVGYVGEDEEVVTVPNLIAGYPVSKIAAGAFMNCPQVTTIYLPDTVMEIEEGAILPGIQLVLDYNLKGIDPGTVVPEPTGEIVQQDHPGVIVIDETFVKPVTTVEDEVTDDPETPAPSEAPKETPAPESTGTPTEEPTEAPAATTDQPSVTAEATAAPTAAPTEKAKTGGIGPGGIAAIAVGGTAALALGAVLVIRRKKQK